MKFDAETIAMLRVLLAGIWIKTIGYMTVGAGIFLAPVSRAAQLIIAFGFVLVAVGWSLVYRALVMSRR
ncbi:hypothetical protein [Archaeoglobus veneficus]|uniref:Uncharacterized protein n=1 Tax=Archaeoglobus veneficus (strain DSM 11195 / SNP6) TaxID=693661 RepID=F2KPL5_ARCVS|nr:hypothetical protein [Archaeoglobus veneficus]AEA47543.1 hypothetical protein Arcve_1541 [Archaeoglobus veneficus SNP6]